MKYLVNTFYFKPDNLQARIMQHLIFDLFGDMGMQQGLNNLVKKAPWMNKSPWLGIFFETTAGTYRYPVEWEEYKKQNPTYAQEIKNLVENELKNTDIQKIQLKEILDSGCVMKFPYLEGISPENYREELELYYVKSKKKYFFHFEYYDTFEHAYFALQNIVYSWRNIYYVLKLLDLGLPAELTADEYWDAIDNSPTIQQAIADKIAEFKALEIKNYGRLVAIER